MVNDAHMRKIDSRFVRFFAVAACCHHRKFASTKTNNSNINKIVRTPFYVAKALLWDCTGCFVVRSFGSHSHSVLFSIKFYIYDECIALHFYVYGLRVRLHSMGFCVIWRVEDSILYWFSFHSMQFHFIVHWNWAPDNHTKTGYSQFGSPLLLFFFISASCCHCHQFYVFSSSSHLFFIFDFLWKPLNMNIQSIVASTILADEHLFISSFPIFTKQKKVNARAENRTKSISKVSKVQKGIPFVLKIGLGRFRFTVDRSVISLRIFNFIDNAYGMRYTLYTKCQ